MRMVAPDGVLINDLESINRVVAHPDVHGPQAAVPSISDALILSWPGMVVAFAEVCPGVHEVHQSVMPEWRGRRAINVLRDLIPWWWKNQPESKALIAPIRREYAGARHVTAMLGFFRWFAAPMRCNDGRVHEVVMYRLERPQ